jgi:hypothetical protein
MGARTVKTLLLAVLLVGFQTTPTLAQHGAASRANCHGLWTAMLASGVPRGDLSRCWSVLQPEIVAAIAEMGSSKDVLRIHTVVGVASGYRTPAVFHAALSLVADRSATHPARMGGFAILMSQYRRDASPSTSATLSESFADNVTFQCQWSANNANHDYEEPLPGDYLDQIRRVTRAIVRTPDERASLRSYARCVNLLLDVIAPVKVPASAIGVRHRCGSVFVLTNSSDERVEVRFQVGDGDHETGTVQIPPHAERVLPTMSNGRVRVFVGGDLAATAENGGTTCVAS